MKTFKELKQSLAELYYEGWEDEDNVITKKDLVENRIDDFEYCDPQNEENIFWDAGYIRGYELALNKLSETISNTDEYESVGDVLKTINYLLNN